MFGFALFPVVDAMVRGRTVDALQTAITFALLTGVVGAIVTALAAFPAFLLLTKRRIVSHTQTLLLGAAVGVVPAAVVLLVQVILRAGDTDTSLVQMATGVAPASAFGALVGVACAAAFWWVAGRHIALVTQDLHQN